MHTPAGANANFYTNLDVDEAIMAGNAAPTFEERYEYYAFAQRQIVEDAVWIFLGVDDVIVAKGANITGGGIQPSGSWLDLRSISVD
jgi:glutathione transport system substrate-binding protein